MSSFVHVHCFHLSDTGISDGAVIHLVQRRKDLLRIGTVLLDIGVGNSLAAESFLENPAVMGLSIDVKTLCGAAPRTIPAMSAIVVILRVVIALACSVGLCCRLKGLCGE